MNVAGIVVLRLTKDLMDFGVDDLALQAFKESGFPEIDAHFPPAAERAAIRKQRASLALRYSLAIAALSASLTLAGLAAALWHMAWWIGSTLLVMTAFSVGLVVVVFAHALAATSSC
jgi:formate/nitrite transporter FocA (FNT family)